jgi:hypothetical protein
MPPDHEDPELGRPVQVQGIAWEDPARPFIARFFATLGNALRPVRGAPQLCGIRLSPAVYFSLLTALPLMLVWGVIPFTTTLLFKGNFRVDVVSHAMPTWLDVSRAMALGLGHSLVTQLAWALPFASLLRAFAASPMPAPLVSATAWRFVFYRAWFLPCADALSMFAIWCLPEQPPVALLNLLALTLRLLPKVVVLLGAQAMALTFGASLLGSLAVAIVPLALSGVIELFANDYVHTLLPTLAQFTQSQ